MKKIFLIAASVLTLTATAQTKEGRVVYERTTQMNNMRMMGGGGNMPPEIQAQMDRMPKTRTDQFELLFTPEHSLYQFLPNATADDGNNTFASGGMVVQMRMANANEMTYVNHASGTRTDQREIMEKAFVVTDTIQKVQWKLSEETKQILSFTARKATGSTIVTRPRITMENGKMKREVVTDTLQVIAWYTTDVPVPTGPNYHGQLPGLILELDINKGQMVTRAIEFSPKVALNKIKEPKEGKRLTAAEFSKEREKMMEEMRRNTPAGNVIRVQ